MIPPLTSLTQLQYDNLVAGDLLTMFYPDATGDWARDTNQPVQEVDETIPVFKVTLLVLGLNEPSLDEDSLRGTLENLRYLEFTTVLDVQSTRVVWDDDHPLNREDTKHAAVKALFP